MCRRCSPAGFSTLPPSWQRYSLVDAAECRVRARPWTCWLLQQKEDAGGKSGQQRGWADDQCGPGSLAGHGSTLRLVLPAPSNPESYYRGHVPVLRPPSPWARAYEEQGWRAFLG